MCWYEVSVVLNLETALLCRDQFNHLIEILQSRTFDIPDVEPENKYVSMTVRDTERAISALESQRKSVNEKKEDLSKALRASSSTFLQSSVSKNNCCYHFGSMKYAWIANFVLLD